MMKCLRLVLVLLVAVFTVMPVFAEETSVAKLTFGENKWIAVHYLLQAQVYSQNIFDSTSAVDPVTGLTTPVENEPDALYSKGFWLRRSRIILKGQVAGKVGPIESVTFFMETDDFKIGKDGPAQQAASTSTTTGSFDDSADITDNDTHTHSVSDKLGTFTQDAFVNIKFADELQVAVGMILLPFMHHNRQSAVSLLGVDYNSAVVSLGGITNVWRDTGVELRGLVLPTLNGKKGLIDYRVGIFRGPSDRDLQGTHETNDDINPYNAPRYCGRVQINILDPESGFFYSGNYLGKKQVISFGGGLDYQDHAVRVVNSAPLDTTKLGAYMAYTADFTIDYGLGDGLAIAVQGAYINVKNEPGTAEKQNGYFIQAGVLIGGNIQPVVKYLKWSTENESDGGNVISTATVQKAYAIYGLNYFINGHNANIKIDYQQPIKKDHRANSGEKKATLQCQIFI